MVNEFKILKTVTKKDYPKLVLSYNDFVRIDLPKIVNFYIGESQLVPQIQVKKYIDINKAFLDFRISYLKRRQELTGSFYWNLLEELNSIIASLEKIGTLPKFLRSSFINDSYSKNLALEYTQRQGESLERIERGLGSNSPDNSSYQLAIRNRLIEEDYTLAGGKALSIEMRQQQTTFDISSVVSVINNSNDLSGLDVDRVITFLDDDISVLNYTETREQSSDILLQLSKEDNPEYPGTGLDKRSYSGSNLASFSYPSFVRQVSESFRTDDSFESISLKTISFEGDSVNFVFEIKMVTGEVLNKTLVL